MKKLFAFGLLLLLGCQSEPTVDSQASSPPLPPPTEATTTPTPEAQPSITPLSEKAGNLQSGMTTSQVLTLLGKPPDAVFQNADLTTYEWSNGQDCQPVSVDFATRDNTFVTTGWNAGTTCQKGSSRNKPIGKPCKNNKLCQVFVAPGKK